MIEPITAEGMRQAYSKMKAYVDPLDYKTAAELIDAVAKTNDTTVDALLSKSRERHLVHPRQDIMRMLQRDLGFSLPRIGRILRRDSSTVSHGVKAAEARL